MPSVNIPQYEVLGEFLKDIRFERFDTMSQASQFFGISHSTVSRYESGKSRPPFGYLLSLLFLYEQRLLEIDSSSDEIRQALLKELKNVTVECYATEDILQDWASLERMAQDYIFSKGRTNEEHNLDTYTSNPQDQNKNVVPLPDGAEILFGRGKDIEILSDKIVSAIKEDFRHFTIILGVAGVGKTALLKALAQEKRVQKKFKNGILWVAFEPDTKRLTAAQAIGKKLNDYRLANAEDVVLAQKRLGELLQERTLLVLVDDVWNKKQGSLFRTPSASSHVCFTTREPMLANSLATSPNDDVYKLDVLLPNISYKLFSKLAPNVVESYPEKSQFLVEKLDGSPLAIRVAAGLLTAEQQLGWDITHLIDELVEGSKLLQADAPLDRANLELSNTPTISFLLNQSFRRLSLEQQTQFGKLGAFSAKSATFSLEAIKEILDISDPKSAIRNLYARGLIEPVGNGRFCIHFLLSRFARNQLDARQRKIVQQNHGIFYLKILQALEAQFGQLILDSSKVSLDIELPNILKAVRWLSKNAHTDQILGQMCIDFARCSQTLGQHLSRKEFISFLNSAIAEAKTKKNLKLEAELWRELGAFNIAKGSLDDAKAQIWQTLTLSQKIEDINNLSRCWGYLGDINRRLTQYDEAINHYTQAIDIAKQTGNYREEGGHTGSLGVAYKQLMQFEKAEACFLSALEVANAVQDYRSIALWTGHLGYLHYANSNLESAIEKTEEAAFLMRQYGNIYEESLHLSNVGYFLLQAGKVKEAIVHCQAILEKCRDAVNPLAESDCLDNLGCAYQMLGKYEKAEKYFEDAISIALRTQNKEKEYEFRKNLGKLLLKIAPKRGDEIFVPLFQQMELNGSQNLVPYMKEVESFRQSLEDNKPVV